MPEQSKVSKNWQIYNVVYGITGNQHIAGKDLFAAASRITMRDLACVSNKTRPYDPAACAKLITEWLQEQGIR